MKKSLCKLLLLLVMTFPMSVFASSLNVSQASVTVPQGGTATVEIIVNDGDGFADITSANASVATVNVGYLDTIASGSALGTEKRYPIVITGVSVGTTTVTIDAYDMAGYDGNSLNKSMTVTVNVVAASSLTYKVSYNANGGTGAPADQTKVGDASLTLSTTKPTREKYSFDGWNTKADGSGTSYSAGGVYTTNADVTLYAQWKAVGNVDSNPNTGDSSFWIILAIAVTFGGYSYWYTKKATEN